MALFPTSYTNHHLPTENTPSGYLQQGEVKPGQQGEGIQIQAEITTTFFVLIGIFFPSVTGKSEEEGWGEEGGRRGGGVGEEEEVGGGSGKVGCPGRTLYAILEFRLQASWLVQTAPET